MTRALRAAMMPVKCSIAASSSAAGTTRLTRPQARAVAASMGSPVSSSSMVRLRATLRPTPTAGVVQNTPTLTPGKANFALSAATARSHVDPSDYRLRQPGQRKHQRVTGAEELLLPGEIGMRAKLLEIVSRTEPAAFG